MLSPKQTWAEGETRSVCGCQVRLSSQNLMCPDFRHLPSVWRLIAQGKAGRQRFLCLWVCVFVRTADRNRKQKADVPSGGTVNRLHMACHQPINHATAPPPTFPTCLCSFLLKREGSALKASPSTSPPRHLSLLSGSKTRIRSHLRVQALTSSCFLCVRFRWATFPVPILSLQRLAER